MTVRKKKRHVSSLEKTQDDLEKTFPEFELCSYDKLAYLIYPELNKLANKSRVPRDIKERQKKFLSEITETLKHMPNKQVSDFLTSKEFVEFQEVLSKLYMSPKIIETEYAMALYQNLILFGTSGLRRIMPKPFEDVINRDLLPLQRLEYSIAEYSKQFGKKGVLAYKGLSDFDFTLLDGKPKSSIRR